MSKQNEVNLQNTSTLFRIGAPALGLTLIFISVLIPVYEDDIFMQIRAGLSILNLGAFDFLDSWSYTVTGHHWYNYYWLSTVLFALLHEVAGSAGLVVLRATLVTVLLFTIHRDSFRSPGDDHRHLSIPGALFILIASFFALIPRLQLRPETLGFLCFALLLSRGIRRNDTENPGSAVDWFGFTILLLWAQLHAGTSVMGVLYLTLTQPMSTKRALALNTALYSFAPLLTPIHWHILEVLQQHSSYDVSLVWNSEWEPLKFESFNLTLKSVPYWSALTLFTLSVGGLAHTLRSKKSKIRWGHVIFVVISMIMTVDRVRMAPYLIMALVPLASLHPWLHRNETFPRVFVIGLTTLASGFLFHLLTQTLPKTQLTIDPEVFPEPLFDFVKEQKPKNPMFSSFAVANYQLLKLPEYPVFVDPRDVIFDSVKPDYRTAFSSPDGMARVLDRWSINTVFIERPQLQSRSQVDGAEELDVLRAFFPYEKWGLVAFSNQKAVFIRRIDTHQKILDSYEFKILRPGQSIVSLLKRNVPNTAVDMSMLLKELTRCLALTPTNAYCGVAQIAVQTVLRMPDGPTPKTLIQSLKKFETILFREDDRNLARELSAKIEKSTYQ